MNLQRMWQYSFLVYSLLVFATVIVTYSDKSLPSPLTNNAEYSFIHAQIDQEQGLLRDAQPKRTVYEGVKIQPPPVYPPQSLAFNSDNFVVPKPWYWNANTNSRLSLLAGNFANLMYRIRAIQFT